MSNLCLNVSDIYSPGRVNTLSYTAYATALGANSYYSTATAFANLSDSNSATFSCWFKKTGGDNIYII